MNLLVIGVECDPCVCEHVWSQIIKGRCYKHKFIIEVDMVTFLGGRSFTIVERGSLTWTTTPWKVGVVLAYTL